MNTTINVKSRGRRIHKAVILAVSVLIFVGTFFVISVFASGPGSSEDPVALKSYVDAKIKELEMKLTGGSGSLGGAADGGSDPSVAVKLDDLSKKVDALSMENAELKRRLDSGGINTDSGVGTGANASSGTDTATGSSVFEIYQIKSGQRVLLGASTEVVIRTGKASAIRGEFGGIINLITGEEYNAGDSVALNNLLLSSRNDSRGLRFNSDSYVMIKGYFEIR